MAAPTAASRLRTVSEQATRSLARGVRGMGGRGAGLGGHSGARGRWGSRWYAPVLPRLDRWGDGRPACPPHRRAPRRRPRTPRHKHTTSRTHRLWARTARLALERRDLAIVPGGGDGEGRVCWGWHRKTGWASSLTRAGGGPHSPARPTSASPDPHPPPVHPAPPLCRAAAARAGRPSAQRPVFGRPRQPCPPASSGRRTGGSGGVGRRDGVFRVLALGARGRWRR